MGQFVNCFIELQFGRPELVSERNCEFRFNWETSLACNKVTPCRTIDPITGFM